MFDELLVSELTDRLQHRDSASCPLPAQRRSAICAPAHRADQGLAYSIYITGSRYRAGTFQIESTREYRAPFQERLLGVIKQVIGPSHRVAKCLVSSQRRAASPTSSLNRSIETIANLVHSHRRHPRCRQFDCQRYAVETPTDLRTADRRVGTARCDILSPFGRTDSTAAATSNDRTRHTRSSANAKSFTTGGEDC